MLDNIEENVGKYGFFLKLSVFHWANAHAWKNTEGTSFFTISKEKRPCAP